jgi:lysophospholipase L1-like esterase
VNSLLRAREGIPRSARRLRAGQPVSIVAFGTSLTLGGAYLDRLPAALKASYPNARWTLTNRGRNGYMTLGAAFRVDADVLPYAPDLVIVEFAHNDVTPILVDFIPSALEGIIAQIRAVLPHCEFVFVYLALPGMAANGPSLAMTAYEAIAHDQGIPSIDLATLSEMLVAGGEADWQGPPERALTVDGVHHGPAAARLLGEPFAEAFLTLLAESNHDSAPPPGTRQGAMTAVARVRAADCLLNGVWAVRPLQPSEERGAGIDEEGLAEAVQPGATIQLAFHGTNAYCWVSGSGVLGVRIEPIGERYRVGVEAVGKWSLCSLMETQPAAEYKVDVIALNAGLLLGDVGITGRLSSA